jgi:threonine dehydrogenase-like Zn-dependent dehydrogenase
VKQAILYGAGDLRFEERPLDDAYLQPDQLYVETEVTALSTGTDLANYLGDSSYVPGPRAGDYPRTVGYSNTGIVRRAGAQVKTLAPGQRVFSLKPHQSAYVAEQDDVIIPVPETVSSEQASLAYLAQLGVAALRQARYQAGENVAVVGLGVIGLCTIALGRAMGGTIVGIANSSLRVEAARRVGAHAAFQTDDPKLSEQLNVVFGEVGPDIVVLTANAWEAYRLSVDIVRDGGRLSILAFPGRGQPPPDFNPLDPRWFYKKQLTILGAGRAPRVDCPAGDLRFNLRRNLHYVMGLMASHSVQLESLITHRFPANQMKRAYELAKEHSKSLIAAVFDWRMLH